MSNSKDSGGQQRKARQTEEVEEATAEEHTSEDVKARHEKLSDDIDAVLDEIDEALETNAEEFVKGFIQKGGQ